MQGRAPDDIPQPEGGDGEGATGAGAAGEGAAGAGAARFNPLQPPAREPEGKIVAPVVNAAITFDSMTQVASTLSSRPADYALKRLENQKHVPLWYFT